MTLAIDKEEILAFLRVIESGEVVLTPLHEPQDVFAGPVEYNASNGWKIAVFNDANEWDYIEWVTTSDGRAVDFFELTQQASELANYAPSAENAWLRYRIPGYLRFRCTRCGAVFDYGKDRVYLCSGCRSGSQA